MKPTNTIPNTKQLGVATHQGGIGLVEVLIAVLILAIGLLGLASMQTNGMRMTNGSMSRSQAVFLANDIVERARANRDNREDYALAPNAVGNVGACNLALAYDATLTVAQNDMAEWLNSLACLLPEADASIAFVTASNRMTVTVDWNRSAGNVENRVMVRTQL
ncbi:type IV pilus modification protein PilV [Saccharospirillum alexandrii]|uniref:type IV pilus modification protein PilV n=1 Tax=Saccharospirillum alexandrii TaxID=2448477 RepID=UPI00373564DC